jgi:2-(1,2-epoxy-1,2-dihydrophenyl)acetyl-CoA isomerase
VVPGDELLARADEWCERISKLPAHALPIAKPLLRASADASWDQSLQMEELAEPMCFTTRGFADGVARVTAATTSG